MFVGLSTETSCLWHLKALFLKFLPDQGRKKVTVKFTQSCLTLCDPMDYTVLGILQARMLEWVAIRFSKGSFQPRGRTQVFHFAGGFFTS